MGHPRDRRWFLSTPCSRARRTGRGGGHLNEEHTATENGCGTTGMSAEATETSGGESLETRPPSLYGPQQDAPRRSWSKPCSWGRFRGLQVVVQVKALFEGGCHIYVQRPSSWSAHIHTDEDSFLRLPS